MHSNGSEAQKFHFMKFSVFFLLLSVVFFLFTGCFKKTDSSLLEKFDQIDIQIAAKQYNDAFSLLKKTEKKVSDADNYVGIIKRALQLSKDDWAEKELIKAIKLYPKNLELRAIYTHMLLRTNRNEEALEIGRKLQNTDYGSLYSEAIILQQKQQNTEFWMQDRFIPIYQDLYKTMGNEKFLINNAVINLLRGDYKTAFTFHPNTISVYDNVFFWALVSYDSQNWSMAIKDASLKLDSLQALLILADSYVQNGELEKGFLIWNKLINEYPKESVPAYINAAKLSQVNNNLKDCYDYLRLALKEFPESVPVLTSFGDYSILSSQPYEENAMDKTLRLQGVKTLAMEDRDSIPVVKPLDVVDRMSDVLKVINDDDLRLSYTKLLWAAKSATGKKRCADMWLLLEKNRENLNGMYSENLCKYAMWIFLHNQQYSDAQQLLEELKTKNYKSISVGNEMEAWLACMLGDYDKAISLYESLPGLKPIKEYSAYNSKNSTENMRNKNNLLEGIPSYPALFNLGALYVASGQKIKAKALYEKALSLVSNDFYCAELYYRIARIQLAQGNNSEAIYNLQYCLKKNPEFNRARLLLKKLSQ
ncbi:MAG: hypothetical protein BKP49_03970 [Treponema sp. CETP13]|nr:MAG: hypothetical protein BKP49_03970 [Treponema sp. CETP13]